MSYTLSSALAHSFSHSDKYSLIAANHFYPSLSVWRQFIMRFLWWEQSAASTLARHPWGDNDIHYAHVSRRLLFLFVRIIYSIKSPPWCWSLLICVREWVPYYLLNKINVEKTNSKWSLYNMKSVVWVRECVLPCLLVVNTCILVNLWRTYYRSVCEAPRTQLLETVKCYNGIYSS